MFIQPIFFLFLQIDFFEYWHEVQFAVNLKTKTFFFRSTKAIEITGVNDK